MDKRISLAGIVFISLALGIFLFKKLTKANDALKVIYTVSSLYINVGDSVVFADNTPGATKWNWDFGDNEVANNQPIITHTYINPGSYKIKLTVAAASGSGKDSSKTIIVKAKELPSPSLAPDTTAHVAAVSKAPEAEKPKAKKHHAHDEDMELPNVEGSSEVK